MTSIPEASTITLRETLNLLDGRFESVALGVAEDRYALWLGSGISFGRVPGLQTIIPRVLEFLRARIEPGDSDCPFRASLNNALMLASISAAEQVRIDFNQPFSSWPDAEAITLRLVSNYARLLDVTVDGEGDDFLLWNGVNVSATYADPSIEPDVEHICIAILMQEGTASEIASANWDGLVERAVSKISGGQGSLMVCVHSDDLRSVPQRNHLYKFHGCAVRAMTNEAKYRPLLVARQSQISSWAAQQEHAVVVHRLIDLLVQKPSLVLGFSIQDTNIQALFAQAEAKMNWPWPGERPSYVFSENSLGADQLALLKNVYRQSLNVATRDQIRSSALIRAYAKPLLLALVFHVISSKLLRLADLATGTLTATERNDLKTGIAVLRNQIANGGDGDRLTFVLGLIEAASRMIGLFRDGKGSSLNGRYDPISSGPLQQMSNDTTPSSGKGEAAVAIALMGLGVREALWTLSSVDITDPASGVMLVTSPLATARILLVADSHAALLLQQNGHLTDRHDLIVIHSREIPVSLARSPRMSPGRTGRSGVREASIRMLLDEPSSSSDLLNRFRMTAAI